MAITMRSLPDTVDAIMVVVVRLVDALQVIIFGRLIHKNHLNVANKDKRTDPGEIT